MRWMRGDALTMALHHCQCAVIGAKTWLKTAQCDGVCKKDASIELYAGGGDSSPRRRKKKHPRSSAP